MTARCNWRRRIGTVAHGWVVPLGGAAVELVVVTGVNWTTARPGTRRGAGRGCWSGGTGTAGAALAVVTGVNSTTARARRRRGGRYGPCNGAGTATNPRNGLLPATTARARRRRGTGTVGHGCTDPAGGTVTTP